MIAKPTSEIELIEESRMTPELDAAIRECLCACFPADAEAFAKARPWHGSPPEYSLIIRDVNKVIAHVGIIVRDILVGGQQVRVAGIQNMSVRPESRKSGLGPALIIQAMNEAAKRNIPFGLLFCVPELEHYYARFGWVKRAESAVLMDYQGQKSIPIPGKNICMVKPLAQKAFPQGDIHLQGPDW